MEEISNSGSLVEVGDQYSLPQTPPPPPRARQLHDRLPFDNPRRQPRDQPEAEAPGYRPMVDGDTRPQSAFDSATMNYRNMHRVRNDRPQSYPHDHNLHVASRYSQAGIGNSNDASGQSDFTTHSLAGDDRLNGTRSPRGTRVGIEEQESAQQRFDELQRNIEAELRMNLQELGSTEGRLSGIRTQHDHTNGRRFAGEDNVSSRAHRGLARDQPPVGNPVRQHAGPNVLQPAANIGHLQYLIDLRPCPANAASEAIVSRIWNTFLMDCRMQHLLLDDRELLFRIPLPDYAGGPVPEHSRIPIGVISIWNNAVRNILDQQPIRLVRHPLYNQIALMFDNPPFMFRSHRPDPAVSSTNGSDRRAGLQPRPPAGSVLNHPLQHPDSGVGVNGSMWRRQLREVANNMFPRNQNRYHYPRGFDNTHPGSDILHPSSFNPYDNENRSNVANGHDIRNLPNLLHQYHQPQGGAVDLPVQRELRFHAPRTPAVVPRAPAARDHRNVHADRAHPYRRPVRPPVAVSTAHHRLSRAVHTPVQQTAMESPFQTHREDSNVPPWAAPLAAPSVSDSRAQEITPPRQPGPYVHRWLSNIVADYPPVDLGHNAGHPVATPGQAAQEPVSDRARRAQQSTLRPANGNRFPESRNVNDNTNNSPDA
jgi:hypothetical protein